MGWVCGNTAPECPVLEMFKQSGLDVASRQLNRLWRSRTAACRNPYRCCRASVKATLRIRTSSMTSFLFTTVAWLLDNFLHLTLGASAALNQQGGPKRNRMPPPPTKRGLCEPPQLSLHERAPGFSSAP